MLANATSLEFDPVKKLGFDRFDKMIVLLIDTHEKLINTLFVDFEHLLSEAEIDTEIEIVFEVCSIDENGNEALRRRCR